MQRCANPWSYRMEGQALHPRRLALKLGQHHRSFLSVQNDCELHANDMVSKTEFSCRGFRIPPTSSILNTYSMTSASSSRGLGQSASPPLRSRSQEPSLRSLEEESTPNSNDEFIQDSQRVATPLDMSHRRSMSDPFDNNHSEGSNGSLAASLQGIRRESFLATMPRYPVAETKNTNCWSEPSVNIFHVRGANYLEEGKKVPSGHIC